MCIRDSIGTTCGAADCGLGRATFLGCGVSGATDFALGRATFLACGVSTCGVGGGDLPLFATDLALGTCGVSTCGVVGVLPLGICGVSTCGVSTCGVFGFLPLLAT